MIYFRQTATYHEQKKTTGTTDPRVLLCKQNLVWKRLDVVQDHKIVNYTVKIYLKEYYTKVFKKDRKHIFLILL
jgi:hypothetical protein